MDQFPHLNFVQKVTGKPRLFGGGDLDERSNENKRNRAKHSEYLGTISNSLNKEWQNSLENRTKNKLAPLPEDVVPVFLKIDPNLIGIGLDLHPLGIEIISEEDDGFILGASLDSLRSLNEKISDFVTAKFRSGLIAQLWDIRIGNREEWVPERILSKELLDEWDHIDDNKKYNVEVSIAFDNPLGKEPDPNKQAGQRRLDRYRAKQMEREKMLLERENQFEEFIGLYGSLESSLVHLEDSFGAEVCITGLGLKDLVFNYPFVFDVALVDEIDKPEMIANLDFDVDFELLAPVANSIEVGVIDSGIMEEHKYISPAIIPANSKCYINGQTSKADGVAGGGHGTRVAGAILYPKGVTSTVTPYQLPCFVRNLRILDGDNSLVTKYPADILTKIVAENNDCKIFNHSINSTKPFRIKHMSSWAATIDSLMHTNDILFVLSTGNLTKDVIKNYIANGENYPAYLSNPFCRIANPGQSSFGITVGSVNHADFEDQFWIGLGGQNQISAFSRIGLGIWDHIKPDVVENGGGLVLSKGSVTIVKENKNICTETIRSTLFGGNAFGSDSVGTSYATPRVTHIAAQLKKLYPDENCNLLRALIVQGARLPGPFFDSPTLESIRHFGYGFPSLERVTTNTAQRISYYNTSAICSEEAHLYSLIIPEDLRNPADDYDVLIEVTLAFTAKVRRTRQRTNSYLGTWLDWISSKQDETFGSFRDFVMKEIEGNLTTYDKDARRNMGSYGWKIRERSDRGAIEGINRNNSSLQKDWAIIKAHQMPKDFSFAVRAHKGWDKSFEEIPYALTVSIEVLGTALPIYEMIRVENEVEVEVDV
jgi:hypothetical protein